MNRPQLKHSTVPRYSDKYKDVLERALKKHTTIIPKNDLQFIKGKSIGVGAFSFVYLVREDNSKTIYAQKSIAKKAVTEELFS